MDFLGLRNLTVIDKTIKLIEKNLELLNKYANELTLLTRKGVILVSSSKDTKSLVPNTPEETILLQLVQNNSYIGIDLIKNFNDLLSYKYLALDLINDYCTSKKECKVISSKIANYGMALKNGFEKAKNEMIISFDIDYFSEQFLIDSISLDKKYSAITASKRLSDSEDGRKLVRRIATNFFVTLLKILFQTSMSDTHGMKAIRKVSLENQIAKVVSTQDLFDTELLIRIERNLEEIYEVPAMVNEIRPSVSVIYSRIPRTIKSLLKLRIQLFNESLNTKNL